MSKSFIATIFGLSLLVSSAASAGEKTVTLAAQHMYCSACPITVKSSLEAVPGVDKVVLSYEEKTAVVTFDDAKTAVPALIARPPMRGCVHIEPGYVAGLSRSALRPDARGSISIARPPLSRGQAIKRWVGQAVWLLQPIVEGDPQPCVGCREDPRRRYHSQNAETAP
jgi:mercuric ion binding protein